MTTSRFHPARGSRGDHLIEVVLAGRDEDSDGSYELLQEFLTGYPVGRLRELLRSENEAAVEAGAWIASELGDDAAPLLDDLTALLDHRSAAVRFDAADAVFGCAGANRGDVIARAIRLIDDPDRGVRWKVMDSMARADRSKLLAGAAHLDGVSYPLLTMLGDSGTNTGRLMAEASLRERRFAAATAGRLAAAGDEEALKRLAETETDELRQFAVDLLRNLRISRGVPDE